MLRSFLKTYVVGAVLMMAVWTWLVPADPPTEHPGTPEPSTATRARTVQPSSPSPARSAGPSRMPAADPVAERQRLVSQRIATIDLTAAENQYKQVIFSDDIFEVMKLAREHKRPILAYYNDGPLGRC